MKMLNNFLYQLTLGVAFTAALIEDSLAGSKDDPVLAMTLIERLEYRDGDDQDPLFLEGQGWIGQDLRKFWYKVEAETVDGETQEAELQALYSQAVAPNWDLQFGLRKDFQPTPSRNWAVIGFQGLAPYYFEVDTALFIGESGRTALRLGAEYELLFTQRLILTPKIEVNIYGQNDPDIGVGSGLSDLEAGLRLRYEIRREIAPYIGVNWNKSFGNTADFARQAGEDTDDFQWVIGVRAWF
ncbi:copper resistance protein B [uncultured Pseudoteredinibacter sp.]|uniref:copper resistance protein B n=1 Tax=uncultured Pseudoteredinibacter sp. TaxID=1641701 RepID=UPI002624219A|nr:copper resistance protein B [uncultured Pseudoteredinibacter sp.]